MNLETLLARIEPDLNSGCWLWPGSPDKKGYIRTGGSGIHRTSYKLHFGEVPDGLFVCHKCDTPACVNPGHLWLGTNHDNVRDMIQKGRDWRGDRTGEKNPKAKLTEKDVLEIRGSARSSIALAAHYGVSTGAIDNARTWRTWKHVGAEPK